MAKVINTLGSTSAGNNSNLSYAASPIDGTIVNSNGTDAVIPLVDSINAGLMSPGSFDLLNSITDDWDEITTDANLGLRLTPNSPTIQGLIIDKAVNGYVGANFRNTDAVGTNAVAAMTVGIQGATFNNNGTGLFHIGPSYITPYLQNSGALISTAKLHLIALNDSDIELRSSPNVAANAVNKFTFRANGQLLIGVPPLLDNTAPALLGRKADGVVVSVDPALFTLDTNALHTTGNETKDGNLTLNDLLILPDYTANPSEFNNLGVNDLGQVVIAPEPENLTISVRNTTGSTINKGSIVYISGASGNKALITLALADSNIITSSAIGMVEDNINNNSNGFVVVAGIIEKLNTGSFIAGDKVYLSPSISGAITTTIPSSPDHVVFIGTVTNAHVTQGSIVIDINRTPKIDELIDVQAPSPANGDILTFNTGTGLWINTPATGNLKTLDGLPFTSTLKIITDNTNVQSKLRLSTTSVTNLGAGTGIDNTAFGSDVLVLNTTGTENAGFGFQVLSVNTTGSYNAGFGWGALRLNTTGTQNTAMGDGAAQANTSANYNVAIGTAALRFNQFGEQNVAVGPFALYQNVGVIASNVFGHRSTAIGSSAMQNNTTGNGTAVGDHALTNQTTGKYNLCFGQQAGGAITTGENNVVIATTGFASNGGITTGNNNMILAPNLGNTTGLTTGSGNIIIGKVTGISATASNTITLANGVGNIRLSFDTAGQMTLVTAPTAGAGTEQVLLRAASGEVKQLPISSMGTPTTRVLNINGNDLDLSADREWRVAQADTGCLTNAGLSVANATQINIGAVTGLVVDNETDPNNPVYTYVNYPGELNKTVTTIGSGIGSYVLLNSSGTIVFQNTFPTSAQRKTHIWLGKVAHPNLVSINSTPNEPDYITSPMAFSRDLFQVLGPYINDGVFPGPNGVNLTFNITGGNIHGDGINFVNDRTKPNEIALGPLTPVTFGRRTRTGLGANGVTTIDNANYDVAGVITAIPGAGSVSTIQWIFAIPGGLTGIGVQYGQTLYATLADATAAVGKEMFTVYPNFVGNALLIGVLAVRKDATDLSNAAQALFFRADKLGQTGGSSAGISTATFQNTYLNSLTPQLTVSDALGPLTNRSGRASNASIISQWQNIAGTITGSITGNGDLTANSFIKPGGTATQHLHADGSVGELKTIGGITLEGTGDIPVQIQITTAVNITTSTLGTGGYIQHGKNVIIDNGANNIIITIDNLLTTASYMKLGTGTVTFAFTAPVTSLVQVDNTAIISGVVGSTASLMIVGTVAYLRISNA